VPADGREEPVPEPDPLGVVGLARGDQQRALARKQRAFGDRRRAL
jgi:hypothetical protein